jgi:hypothetical protein
MNRWDLLFALTTFSTFTTVFVPMFIVFAVSGKRAKAAQEKAHARRLADYRMNARLLRLDI